jgi:hypothetical protein
VAFALRILLWGAVLLRSGTSGLLASDTASYLEPGRNLLLHGLFQTAGQPEIGRTPGYPLFLAIVSLPGWPVAALAQVALSVLNVWLGARLARTAGLGKRGVLCAAWLLALEPMATIYSVRLLSETLFCLILLVSLERMAAFLGTHSWSALAGSGMALAAAVYVRPVAWLLPWFWALGLLLVCWKERGPQQVQRSPSHALAWKSSALLLATTLPFLALWQVRNCVETGFNGFSSIVVRNAYFYSAAVAEARATGRGFDEVQHAFGYPDESTYLLQHPEQAAWSQTARLAFMQAQARRILAAHWQSAFQDQMTGSLVVAFSPGAAELLQMLGLDVASAPVRVVHQGPLSAALRIVCNDPLRATVMALFELVLLALYLMAARGAWCGGFKRPALLLLLATAFYFIAVSGGVQAVGRLRMPVMPVLCVLAGAGLATLLRRPRTEGN